MFKVELDHFSSAVRDSLIVALEQLGVDFQRSGFDLEILDTDRELVAEILKKLQGGVGKEGAVDVTGLGAQTIRYEMSEVDPLAIAGIVHDLGVDGIAFNFKDHILSVERSAESRVDETIIRNERIVRELDTYQIQAREERSGQQASACEICGTRPAAQIDLRRQVGMVVVRQFHHASAVLCESCGRMAYQEFQKSTAIKGWTGVLSALTNPIVMGSNAVSKKRHKDRIRKVKGI